MTNETEAADYSRRQVMRILKIPLTSLRRLEGKELHPTQDERGRWRFDPDVCDRIRWAKNLSAADYVKIMAERNLPTRCKAFRLRLRGRRRRPISVFRRSRENMRNRQA